MKEFKNLFFFLFLIGLTQAGHTQQIILDEEFNDWPSAVHTDPLNDGSNSGVDISEIFISNDDQHLYISFIVDEEIVLQDYFGLSLYLDIDNNANTGIDKNGIGADLIYPFAQERDKNLIVNGFSNRVFPNDAGFMALPSVSATRFELRLNRKLFAGNNEVNMASSIKLFLEDFNGDSAPDNNGIEYTFQDIINPQPINLLKEDDSDIRIMSLNVKRDQFFEDGSRQATSRILRAVNPDVIAFQEIYDHTAAETELQVATALNVSSSSLYSARVFPDIVLVSKYPIEDVGAVSNNGVFKIKIEGRDWVIINCHLACCENDEGRNEEVSNILSYIEDLKVGDASVEVAPNSPILILGDMNFVGESAQPNNFITGEQAGPDWGGNMEDAKPRTTGESSTFTWYNPFSSFHPGRLDYVFYSGSVLQLKNNFNVFTPGMDDSFLQDLGLNDDDSTVATDHLAVVVDFARDQSSSSNNLVQVEIIVYPNPTSDYLHLSESFDYLSIHNVQGQIIMDAHYPSNRLDLSQLASGSYVLSAQKDGKLYRKTIQKI
jgi:endonuclease/exonuclease/phosphatase family metal-dependent hydrolase